MTTNLIFTKTLIISIVALSALSLLSSCGGDDKGCMDPTSANYNADVTEDDGSCTTYNRDRFYGNYVGQFTCMQAIFKERLDNDSLVFSINEPVDSKDAFNVIFTLEVDGFPVNLNGRVEGDIVTIDDTEPGLELPDFPIQGESTPVNVIGLGTATLSNNDQTLAGPLNLRLEFADGSGFLEDDCDLVGEKQ